MVVLGEIWPIVTPGRSSLEAPRRLGHVQLRCPDRLGPAGRRAAPRPRDVLTFLAKRKAPHRAAFNAAASATLSLAPAGRAVSRSAMHHSPRHPWVPSGTDIWRIVLAGAACFVVVLRPGHRGRRPARPRAAARRRCCRRCRTRPSSAWCCSRPRRWSPSSCGKRSALLVLLFAFPLAAIYVNAAISVQREHQAHHDELTGLREPQAADAPARRARWPRRPAPAPRSASCCSTWTAG